MMIEDFEKCALIAKYLHMTSYYIENEVTQAKNNLLNRQRTDAYALLEYYRFLPPIFMYFYFYYKIFLKKYLTSSQNVTIMHLVAD